MMDHTLDDGSLPPSISMMTPLLTYLRQVESQLFILDAASCVVVTFLEASLAYMNRIYQHMLRNSLHLLPTCQPTAYLDCFHKHILNNTVHLLPTCLPTNISHTFGSSSSTIPPAECLERFLTLHLTTWPKYFARLEDEAQDIVRRRALERRALSIFEHCFNEDDESPNNHASWTLLDRSGLGCPTHPSPFLRQWFTSADFAPDVFAPDAPRRPGIFSKARRRLSQEVLTSWRRRVCLGWEVIEKEGDGKVQDEDVVCLDGYP